MPRGIQAIDLVLQLREVDVGALVVRAEREREAVGHDWITRLQPLERGGVIPAASHVVLR
jgi:hypothetical protein